MANPGSSAVWGTFNRLIRRTIFRVFFRFILYRLMQHMKTTAFLNWSVTAYLWEWRTRKELYSGWEPLFVARIGHGGYNDADEPL